MNTKNSFDGQKWEKKLNFLKKFKNFGLKISGDRTSIGRQFSHKPLRTLGMVLKWPQDLDIKSQPKIQDFCFDKFFTIDRFLTLGSWRPPLNSYRVKAMTLPNDFNTFDVSAKLKIILNEPCNIKPTALFLSNSLGIRANTLSKISSSVSGE